MTSSDNILRDFIHLGATTEEVSVLGFKIRYKTLTTDEQTAVFAHCSRYEDFARVSALRRETLIYAIDAVNGIRLEDLYNKEDKDDVTGIEKARRILGGMDTEAINVIFAQHSRISEERSKSLESYGKAEEEMTEEDRQKEEGLKNSLSEDQTV